MPNDGPGHDESARNRAAGSREPAMRIRDLRFSYGSGAHAGPAVLDIASLEVQAGEQVLLTGGSGTGKSTLLGLVCGLLDPTVGEVLVNGTALHGLAGAARDRFRGRTIGVIFQTFNLLVGFSARENVLAALLCSSMPANEHEARAKAALDRLGIARPDERVERLSVGQQQRVAVARAVVCSPALVLADEPTASLDPSNAGVAMDLIQQTCRDTGAALLCVSHDPSLESRFARRIRLEEVNAAGAGRGVAAAGVQS